MRLTADRPGDDLIAKIADAVDRGIDGAQPKALSLTQLTERGTAYSLMRSQS
jgi:hypothetical protein